MHGLPVIGRESVKAMADNVASLTAQLADPASLRSPGRAALLKRLEAALTQPETPVANPVDHFREPEHKSPFRNHLNLSDQEFEAKALAYVEQLLSEPDDLNDLER